MCTTDADCNYTNGVCESALECSGETSVVIEGHTGNSCTTDDDCVETGETTCDTGAGLCKFEDTVQTDGRTGNGAIDVCYPNRDNTCAEAKVLYCDGLRANVQNPAQTGVFIPTFLRTVALGDSCETDADYGPNNHCDDGQCEIVLDTSEACTPSVPTCTNEPGSLCCTLTQGAYGTKNSVATATGNCSASTGLGFIPAAICNGDDPFNDGNAPDGTTIGLYSTRSVTVLDLQTLIAYLPAGGTASSLASNTGNKIYSGGTITLSNNNVSGSGSKGNGAGVLASQTMACQINDFLSDTGFTPGGVTGNLGGFELTSLVCTRRSGPDKVLGNGDDIYQNFSYPSCVVGKTVQEVLDAANAFMAGLCPADSDCITSCTATDLNNALSNINLQFDQCGEVIDCGS